MKTRWYYSAHVQDAPITKLRSATAYKLSDIREWLKTLDDDARTVIVHKSHTGEFAAEYKRMSGDIYGWYRTTKRRA